MVLDSQEREQLNRLKKFWRLYGKQIFLAVGLTVIAAASLNIYTSWQNRKLGEAVELYEQFRQLDIAWQETRATRQETAEHEAHNASGGVEEAENNATVSSMAEYEINQDDILAAMEEVGELLRTEYVRRNQAAYANLRLATLYAQQGESAAAQSLFKWILENSPSSNAGMRAGILLARLLLEEGKAPEALALLESQQQDVSAESAELRGDILTSLARSADARSAYEQAIARGGNKEFILYKISLLLQ